MDIYMKTNGTWDIISMKNGGQLGIEKMPKLMISFTIAGTTYQAEDGMTWGDWVESEYNTGGYRYSSSSSSWIGDSTNSGILCGAAGSILTNNMIVANGSYYIEEW